MISLSVGVGIFIAKCDSSNNYCLGSNIKQANTNPVSESEGNKSPQDISPFLGSIPITKAEKVDYQIRRQLSAAATKAEQDRTIGEAITAFETLLEKYPTSARAQFGLARCLDRQSGLQQSNQLLERSIEEYSKLGMSEGGQTLVGLRIAALEKMAERASFRGYKHKARAAYLKLSEIEPDVANWRNLLGIEHLMSGQNNQVKCVIIMLSQQILAAYHVPYIYT